MHRLFQNKLGGACRVTTENECNLKNNVGVISELKVLDDKNPSGEFVTPSLIGHPQCGDICLSSDTSSDTVTSTTRNDRSRTMASGTPKTPNTSRLFRFRKSQSSISTEIVELATGETSSPVPSSLLTPPDINDRCENESLLNNNQSTALLFNDSDGQIPKKTAPLATTDHEEQEKGQDVDENDDSVSGLGLSKPPSSLMRLFESSCFDLDLAIEYLFKMESPSIQAYLVNRLFSFPSSDVDFYLLQLISLYHQSAQLAVYLHAYFLHRCKKSAEFAIHLVWLLDSFNPPAATMRSDSIPRTSSAILVRPSSVPTFAQSISSHSLRAYPQQLMMMMGNHQPAPENEPLNCDSHSISMRPLEEDSSTVIVVDETDAVRVDYSVTGLRSLLLPPWECSLALLQQLSSFNGGKPNPASLLDNNNSDNAQHPASNGLHHSRRSCYAKPLGPLVMGHKRAVSDLTSISSIAGEASYTYNLHHVNHQRPDLIEQRRCTDEVSVAYAASKIRTMPLMETAVTKVSTMVTETRASPSIRNHWSSEDSAVSLHSRDADNIASSHSRSDRPSCSFAHLPIYAKTDAGQDSDQLNVTRHSSSFVHRSCVNVNGVVTKEILMSPSFEQRLRTIQSLQRLDIGDPGGPNLPSRHGRHSSVQFPLRYCSPDATPVGASTGHQTETELQSNQTGDVLDVAPCGSLAYLPTTATSSPPDSGLQMIVAESSDVVDTSLLMHRQTDPLQLFLVPRLVPQWEFVDGLLRLARRLVPIVSKEQRTAFLQAELANLNLHLPARVWLPVNKADHIILRIPPVAAVCLNSKDKAPYLIYVEVLCCDDPWSVPVPVRPSGGSSAKMNGGGSCISVAAGEAHSLSSLSGGPPWMFDSPSSGDVLVDGSTAADALSLISTDSVVSSIEDPYPQVPLSTTRPSVQPLQQLTRSMRPAKLQLNDGTMIMTDDDVAGNDDRAPSYLGNGDVSDAAGPVSDDTPNTPIYVTAGEIRDRLKQHAEQQPHRSFRSDPEDPSAAVLKEPWHVKCKRIREHSPWGYLPGWRLTAAIVKVGDDLRQEQLAYQLLSVLLRIWKSEYVSLWLRPLTVIVTSPDSGLIEPVPDTVSLHQIRRHARLPLLDYFLREYGPPMSEAFLNAQRNFVHSCAAYCLVSYLFQVKDRHNGNILLDNEGHVIHIDYGFMLSASPGKNLGFETSPFKLTMEQVQVMGGLGSDMFEYYKCLLLKGLLAARKHMEKICILVDIARAACPKLPCFIRSGGNAAVVGLRQRFLLSRTEDQLRQMVDNMVDTSLNSVTTRLYDSFQYYTSGIQ